jgi:hypothetical protein
MLITFIGELDCREVMNICTSLMEEKSFGITIRLTPEASLSN